MRTTVGKLLVRSALPEEMAGEDRVLDKDGLKKLFGQIAAQHPERYAEVSKALADIGRQSATEFGGYTFGLQHLKKSQAGKKHEAQLRNSVTRILNDDSLTDKERDEQVVAAATKMQAAQTDAVYDESLAEKNPLALQVLSGSRGNKSNLSSLRGSDVLYTDHKGRPVPVPIYRSYSQGLTPTEYWAGSYGARKGILDVKLSTAKAGYLSKILNQVSHRLMVTDYDYEDEKQQKVQRGLPVDTNDSDNEGALLAFPVGPYNKNTVLTPKILKDMSHRGYDRIVVRSPLVGGSPEGGVYGRDIGIREEGRIPGRGTQVGLLAAQALSEPLAQGQLSSKHSGGVAGQEKAVGGFEGVDQLVQIPKTFKGGATHAGVDGMVERIEPAPAGGYHVTVGGESHYVPQDLKVTVKRGDRIEAGDLLSEGTPRPDEIVKHKGIGEGRRYFMNSMKSAMANAGIKAHRRNLELLSRGLINHVRLTEEHGDYVPDDIVPYSTLEHVYEPRPGHVISDPERAAGKHLEQPVLHYSIGTKLKPSVLKDLKHFGVKSVVAHDDPPPFESEMIRGMYVTKHDPDYMTRMYGSGLKDSLLDAAHRGAVSSEEGTSFVPGLAHGSDFGRIGLVRQPEPSIEPPDSLQKLKKSEDQLIVEAQQLLAKYAEGPGQGGTSTGGPHVAPATQTPAIDRQPAKPKTFTTPGAMHPYEAHSPLRTQDSPTTTSPPAAGAAAATAAQTPTPVTATAASARAVTPPPPPPAPEPEPAQPTPTYDPPDPEAAYQRYLNTAELYGLKVPQQQASRQSSLVRDYMPPTQQGALTQQGAQPQQETAAPAGGQEEGNASSLWKLPAGLAGIWGIDKATGMGLARAGLGRFTSTASMGALDTFNRTIGIPTWLGGKGIGNPGNLSDFTASMKEMDATRTDPNSGLAGTTAAMGQGFNVMGSPLTATQAAMENTLKPQDPRTGLLGQTEGAVAKADQAVAAQQAQGADTQQNHWAAMAKAQQTGMPYAQALQEVQQARARQLEIEQERQTHANRNAMWQKPIGRAADFVTENVYQPLGALSERVRLPRDERQQLAQSRSMDSLMQSGSVLRSIVGNPLPETGATPEQMKLRLMALPRSIAKLQELQTDMPEKYRPQVDAALAEAQQEQARLVRTTAREAEIRAQVQQFAKPKP